MVYSQKMGLEAWLSIRVMLGISWALGSIPLPQKWELLLLAKLLSRISLNLAIFYTSKLDNKIFYLHIFFLNYFSFFYKSMWESTIADKKKSMPSYIICLDYQVVFRSFYTKFDKTWHFYHYFQTKVRLKFFVSFPFNEV